MHTIQIADELWEAYGASPTRMRDVLWAAAHAQVSNGRTAPEEHQQGPAAGTIFTARRSSWCPRCGDMINPGEKAVMMNWQDPETGHTRSRAFDPDCAVERGWKRPE